MFPPGRSSVEHRPSVDCFGKHHADRCSHHLCDSVFPRPVGKVDKLSYQWDSNSNFFVFIYQQHKTCINGTATLRLSINGIATLKLSVGQQYESYLSVRQH